MRMALAAADLLAAAAATTRNAGVPFLAAAKSWKPSPDARVHRPIQATTYVNAAMTPTDTQGSLDLDQTRTELRKGLETSRAIVRQTRELIELTECEAPYAANDNAGDDFAT